MKYTYEATYEDCSPDGTVLVSAEVRFTYTVIWGCPARIHYDEHDHPAEGDELEIVNTEVEGLESYLDVSKKLIWRGTNKDEHEILCAWGIAWHDDMIESARDAEEAAAEHAAETRADLLRLEDLD